MAAINVQGTISPLWREQVVANPPMAQAITAGGGSGTNTVTIAAGVYPGLNPGVLVTFSVGTPEPVNAQVLAYNSGTGVVTLAANLTNAHTTGNLLWGYSGVVYDGGGGGTTGGFSASADGNQSPALPGAQISATYGGVPNQKLRVWDLQLRQSSIYT